MRRRNGWRSRKASTASGSNCRPPSRTISAAAASQLPARRYGRSLVIASSASATANTRAPGGISALPSPSGYPRPSHRSWWWRTTCSPCPCSRATSLSSCSPRTVCVSSSLRSDCVRLPGFRRILSGIPILPTSWRRKPYSRLSSSRKLDRVALDPLRVCAGAHVLRLEGVCKSGHRLVIRALDERALAALDVEQPAEILRVEDELFLRRRALRAGRPLVEAACDPLDDVQQLERAKRLANEGVGARRARGLLGARVRAREEDDPDVARHRVALQLPTERDAVGAWHGDVEHDDVGCPRHDLLLRLGNALRLVDLDVDDLESRSEEDAKSRVVVDEEQAQPAVLVALRVGQAR